MPVLLLKLLPYGIVLLMAWGLWNKVQALAVLETEFEKQRDSIAVLQGANDTTVASLSECTDTNTLNALAAEIVMQRSIQLETRLAAFEGVIKGDIEDIAADENELRLQSQFNENCYALVDRLPDFLFD